MQLETHQDPMADSQTKRNKQNCFSLAKNKTNKIINGHHTKRSPYLPRPSYKNLVFHTNTRFIYVSAEKARQIKK